MLSQGSRGSQGSSGSRSSKTSEREIEIERHTKRQSRTNKDGEIDGG